MTFEEDLKNAVDVMKRGGVILYPTDTVWGIGCDATRSDAVNRVFEIKKRADSKAMIVLLGSADLLPRYVDEVPDVAYELIEVAVRPLTIVYDGARGLAPEVIAGDGSVGIRVTSENVSRRLCDALRRPVVSTSANISGTPTPKVFREISKEIIDSVDYVMSARRDETEGALPSSVIKLGVDGCVKIIRK